MPVMIGVDPHKASHTAAALDEHGQLLGQQRFPATLEGYQALCQWAGRWDDRLWAVEGAHGVGQALAQRLVADGEHVLDVPAKLAARVRVLSIGHGRKTDPDDAVSVAVATQSVPQLRRVGVEDQAVVLHLLTKRREDLVAMRTQTVNRLHRLLVDLVPGGARRNLTAKRAAAMVTAVTPAGQPALTRWQLATELVADVRQLVPRPESFALFDGCRLGSRRGQIADSVAPARRATAALYRQLVWCPGRTAWRVRQRASKRGRRRCRRQRSRVQWLRPCRPPHHLA